MSRKKKKTPVPKQNGKAFAEDHTGRSAEQGNGAVAEVGTGAVPETGRGAASEMRKGAASEMRKGAASEMRKGAASEMRKGAASEMRKGAASEMRKDAASGLEKGAASKPGKGSATGPENGAVAEPEKRKPERYVVIGDIHGCASALQKLLKKTAPDPAGDTLIFLGDLFDRGPDSWEVFQEVQTLQKRFGDRFVLLRGNHEDYLLSRQLSFMQKLVWERVGRRATVNSFKEHGERMEDSAYWISEHSVIYYTTKSFQCVHAGLMVEPPEANDSYTMMHDHSIVLQNHYAGSLTITGHIALDDAMWFAGDGETVRKLPDGVWSPLPEYGVICIDTGCGKGGRLTGMVIEKEQYILYGVEEA